MASTSSAHKYDVFLSFRGEDTRYSFTDHLYEALKLAGIRTFWDDNEIRHGQQLKSELERSIKDSKASVTVISENYANSKSQTVAQTVYKVKQSENAFIKDFVQNIYRELDLKLLSIPTNLAGIETRARDINTWLKNEQPRSPVLAICGMGGIGKTTLAKYIYNSNKQNFESSSFLEVIVNQPSYMLGLQKQLLSDLGNNIMISSDSEGTLHVEKAIQRKKALIVVDDIDDADQLSTLFGTKALHTQSRIIITTRHLRIDTKFDSISSGCHVHKVALLNRDESLELLSWHAFESKIPIEGFEEVAIQLAQYCEGNPLALKVLGSSLPVTAQDQRTRNQMIEMWRSRMNSLNSLKGDLDHRIQHVLYKSFESLPSDKLQELFLHIASLFIRENKYDVEEALEKDWDAKNGVTTLINRCLVTVTTVGYLEMHKLLQDMASQIVYKESEDPAKRSRVWHKDDAYRLLREGDGSKRIKGLLVDMEEPELWMTSEPVYYTGY
ncbi:disease resistance protein RPV1-like [Bidens hawaiensis]|uniref:disease resistance protein RPV1-like n=1 Tax=Bidens hawaiensis TaxID=980011 RepID=UPI00404B0C9E